MAISIVGSAQVLSSTTTANTYTATSDFTVTGGADHCLVVCFGAVQGSNIADAAVGVTAEGVTMNAAVRQAHSIAPNNYAGIYYLMNPASGATTMVASSGGVNFGAGIINVIELAGVDSADPLGAIAATEGTNHTTIATTIVPEAAGNLVISQVAARGGSNPFGPTGSAAELFDSQTGTSGTSDVAFWVGTYTTVGTSSVDVGADGDTNLGGIFQAVEFRAAAGGTTYDDTMSLGAIGGLTNTRLSTMVSSMTAGVGAGLTNTRLSTMVSGLSFGAIGNQVHGSTAGTSNAMSFGTTTGLTATREPVVAKSMALGAVTGLADAALLVAPAAMTLGATVGVTSSASIIASRAMALASSSGLSFGTALTASSALTLATAAEIIISRGALLNESLSFATSTGVNSTAALTSVATLSLGATADLTATRQHDMAVALVLAAAAGVAPGSQAGLSSALTLGSVLNFTMVGEEAGGFDKTVALAFASGLSMQAQLVANNGMALGSVAALDAAGSITMAAGFALDAVTAVTTSGGSLFTGALTLGVVPGVLTSATPTFGTQLNFAAEFDAEATAILSLNEALDLAVAAAVASSATSSGDVELFVRVPLAGTMRLRVSLTGLVRQ